MKRNWKNSRCHELTKLNELLNEILSMNRGSNIVGRILKCEKIARTLQSSDMTTGRPSFVQFLTDLAAKERSGK